jgi:hypothetical protein
MSNNTAIPKTVLEAFPTLSDATFMRRLASPVPLVPDTTFDIFAVSSRGFMALVATDYADPLSQSQELKSISGEYGFEFANLRKPYGKNNETAEVLDIDIIEDNFFIVLPYRNHKVYYYLANLKF